MENIIVKKQGNTFFVRTNGEILCCTPRGKHKKQGIFVGDIVELSHNGFEHIIERVCERKNQLIRPPVCNIDTLVIVVASIPKPDYSIVDKLILFCKCYDIEPLIVVNKQDISRCENEYIEFAYGKHFEVVNVSAKSGENIDCLKKFMENKLCAFAGQSAVGKSALINSLITNYKTDEGELSKKIERGKNTTRHLEIFCEDNFMICDTAGFTSLDERLLPISYFELCLYYPEFVELSAKCKYTPCTHIDEPLDVCEVKKNIKAGNLDKGRYLRYKKIYLILKEEWEQTHG